MRVPDRDTSPPVATIALVDDRRTLAEATGPAGEPPDEVELTSPRPRGVAAGEDANGGIARVRVSISERIGCRTRDGARFERRRRRYFPPPQTESIRAAPGALLPTRESRSRALSLAASRCGPGAETVALRGRLWAEVINGSGLETISPPIRFRYGGDTS